jgi:hypothetical protein
MLYSDYANRRCKFRYGAFDNAPLQGNGFEVIPAIRTRGIGAAVNAAQS